MKKIPRRQIIQIEAQTRYACLMLFEGGPLPFGSLDSSEEVIGAAMAFGGNSMSGSLSCLSKPNSKILVARIVHGYGNSRSCANPDESCDMELFSDPAIASNCDGRTTCSLDVLPKRLEKCNFMSDFVHVEYECVADNSVFDICREITTTVSEPSLFVVSPNVFRGYSSEFNPWKICECIISSRNNFDIMADYIHSDIRVSGYNCSESYILIESKKSPRQESVDKMIELCGRRSITNHLFQGSVRITYYNKNFQTDDGFLTKFRVTQSTGRAETKMQCGPVTSAGRGTPPSNYQRGNIHRASVWKETLPSTFPYVFPYTRPFWLPSDIYHPFNDPFGTTNYYNQGRFINSQPFATTNYNNQGRFTNTQQVRTDDQITQLNPTSISNESGFLRNERIKSTSSGSNQPDELTKTLNQSFIPFPRDPRKFPQTNLQHIVISASPNESFQPNKTAPPLRLLGVDPRVLNSNQKNPNTTKQIGPSGKLDFLKKLTLTSSLSEVVSAETVRKLINVNNSEDSSLQTGRKQTLLGDDKMATERKQSSISQGRLNSNQKSPNTTKLIGPSGKLDFLKKLTLTSSSSEVVSAETVRKLINVNNSQDSSLQTGRKQTLLGDDKMATERKQSSISQGHQNKPASIKPSPRSSLLKDKRQFKDKQLSGTISLNGYWMPWSPKIFKHSAAAAIPHTYPISSSLA
ncbi:unnamed protein product [Mytilus coruscus]|uniref:Uncharacterized protein n=1 Tax=Mytilus coruscus TaxID=42192 RepID=A0A6J8BDE8_MYTCO|nr:unnamed protein product [Mytilus coruscus]